MKLSQKTLIIIGIILLIILASTPSYYFYTQYKKAQQRLDNPNIAATEETKALIDRVGQHIVLPVDEQPTVATISDKEKLKDQPFFANAKNGDKVLIYNLARRAILFDPVADKIIDVAPINISTPSANTVTQTQTPLKIALYNGTNTAGLTGTVETDIKQKMDNVDVIVRENAAKRDYVKTIVVDIVGNKAEGTKAIAAALNGEVAELPAGEARPVSTVSGQVADILVIIGSDYLQ